jgi:sugar lactone lactonase YvrE
LQAEDDDAPSLRYIGPGRPLGFHVVDDGQALLVCDSLKGLLRVELGATGTVTVLANSLTDGSSGAGPQLGGNSHMVNYANDLDVAKDGTVFFSSSTASAVAQHQDGFYDTMRSFLLNMCCGDHTGRLLAYDPSTGQTGEIVSGLWYANGVAIAHDEKSVLVRRPCGILLFVPVIAVPTIALVLATIVAVHSVCQYVSPCCSHQVVETMGFRIIRRWLDGPKKGQSETFLGSLPGFPDGITRSENTSSAHV